MDIALYISNKFGINSEEDLTLEKKREIWNYYQKNSLGKLGDDGNIVLQLLSSWLYGQKKSKELDKIKKENNYKGVKIK